MNRRLCVAILASIAAALGAKAVAQQTSPQIPDAVPLISRPSCTQQMCHMIRAGILFGYSGDDGCPQCLRTLKTDPTDRIERMRLGIEELKAAQTLPTAPELVRHAVERTLAMRYLILARAYREQANYEQADKAVSDAAAVYLQLSKLTDVLQSDLQAEIVTGLIRCGRPLQALEIAEQMPKGNPERSYLQAEALFSMGDREGAALAYERWMSSGCVDYKFRMIVQDAFGIDQWSLLNRLSDMGKSPCENLPVELRVRMEALRNQYQHPNNLPEKNYAPEAIHPPLR